MIKRILKVGLNRCRDTEKREPCNPRLYEIKTHGP